jgi:hypothetical protein
MTPRGIAIIKCDHGYEWDVTIEVEAEGGRTRISWGVAETFIQAKAQMEIVLNDGVNQPPKNPWQLFRAWLRLSARWLRRKPDNG